MTRLRWVIAAVLAVVAVGGALVWIALGTASSPELGSRIVISGKTGAVEGGVRLDTEFPSLSERPGAPHGAEVGADVVDPPPPKRVDDDCDDDDEPDCIDLDDVDDEFDDDDFDDDDDDDD